MGTVVFPRAKCKIYLDASLDERAQRRAREFEAKGIQFDFEKSVHDYQIQGKVEYKIKFLGFIFCIPDKLFGSMSPVFLLIIMALSIYYLVKY